MSPWIETSPAARSVAACDVVLRLDVGELLVTQARHADATAAVAAARELIGG